MLMSGVSPKCRGLLLGCVVGWCCGLPFATAQDSLDDVETLTAIEVDATIIEEERNIRMPEPETTPLVTLTGLVTATIPRTHPVSQTPLESMRDSIADRKGMWKFVRLTAREEQRHLNIPEPDTTPLMASTGLMTDGLTTTPIPRTHPASQTTLEMLRDSTADRKAVRKPVRPIRTNRPPYPQVARKRGWEGTVVLRLTVNREGNVERVNTHKSSGFPDLDESAAQAVKTWRFSPAKDGEFPISATVDLPVRFDLDEYND